MKIRKMKNCLLLILLVTFSCAINNLDDSDKYGWKPLFSNDSLKGWTDNQTKHKAYKKNHWTLKNGILETTGRPNGLLYSKKSYKNFELKFDWKHHEYAKNSGLFIWLKKIGKTLGQGTEVQILDPGYEKRNAKSNKPRWFTGHGDVFPVATKMTPFLPSASHNKGQKNRSFPTEKRTNSYGNWNHYHIKAVNGVIRLLVNGKEVSGGYDIRPDFGPLAFESEGGKVSFRNIMIKDLPDDYKDQGGILKKEIKYSEKFSKEAREKFLKDHKNVIKFITNGKASKDWKSFRYNGKSKKGELKAPKGAVSKKQFKDFKLFVEFKLDKNANAGLLLRYSGKGDGAYGGMCELQVLDNRGKRYHKLDSRQYHGSAYGMKAAKQGYQLPVGQWNHQEVIVKGHRIQVILNGHEILNTDLSLLDAKSFFKRKAHLGRLKLEGYLGLGGHNSGVYYKNLYLHEIN